MCLVLANLVFGFVQVGLPPDSPLRLYPELGNGFGGVLVNENHQGTALLIGMLLSFPMFAGAVIWVFAARTALRAWTGLAIPALVLGLVILLALRAGPGG